MTRLEQRLSLLVQLDDKPGALEAALHPFARHGVNLTHIESRPARGNTFDFYVDCEGTRGENSIEGVIEDLEALAVRLFILDHKQVPWFPRHIADLDAISNNTLDAGTDLQSDHPGFSDDEYRERRAHIDQLARDHRHDAEIPLVDYTDPEIATWREIYQRLQTLHESYACDEYRRIFKAMERHCGYAADRIPQGRDVSAFLESRTGFRIRPVAGLLSSRDFLNGLAFRVLFATQYIRHHSKPLYTPEPDVCHELIGHAPMFADSAFADLSQEIGLASLGASDTDIERLARCYWHSVEFGLLREGGRLKAYGAGLLSSFGELESACGGLEGARGGLQGDSGGLESARGGLETDCGDSQTESATQPEYKDWEPTLAAEQTFPITDYQPIYFVAESLQDAKLRMRQFCRELPRPFYARYNSTTQRIWVDRAVQRQKDAPTQS